MRFRDSKMLVWTQRGRSPGSITFGGGMTLLEMVLALAMVVIIGAVILPQFRAIDNGWDSREAAAEVIQNGRVLTEHLGRNLSQAVKITAVTEPNLPNGFIEFEDNAGGIWRYDMGEYNYIEFGEIGAGESLAGPVSSLQFTCYDGNDFSNPITDGNDANSIRFVKAEVVFTNSASLGQDKTFTAWAYLRPNGINKGDGDVQTTVVYGEYAQTLLRYRLWDGAAWSGQNLANDVGSRPKWVVAAKCPNRCEIAACALDLAYDLNIQFYDGFAWSSVTELADNLVTAGERPFHAAYEQSSGDLLIAYRRGNNGLLYYRIYDGSSISAESTTGLSGSGNPKWVRLVPKPDSDEILCIVEDAVKDVTGLVWDGSSWGNSILLEDAVKEAVSEGIWAAYEGTSKDALVVWSAETTNTFQYRTWDGSAWSAESDGPDIGYDPKWLKLAADPCSDQMIVGALGRLGTKNHLEVAVWNGSAWSDPCEIEPTLPSDSRRNFDIAYENCGSDALLVWGRTNVNNCFYRAWDGSSWSSEQTSAAIPSRPAVIQLVPSRVPEEIFLAFVNQNDDLQFMVWDGSSLTDPVTLVDNLSGDNSQECFMVAVTDGSGPILP